MAHRFLYILRWDRAGRRGQRCRIVARGRATNSVLVAFEDRYEMVTSRNAIVRAKAFKNSVAVKVNRKGGRGESPEPNGAAGRPRIVASYRGLPAPTRNTRAAQLPERTTV